MSASVHITGAAGMHMFCATGHVLFSAIVVVVSFTLHSVLVMIINGSKHVFAWRMFPSVAEALTPGQC
jgi:hypothetical protein